MRSADELAVAVVKAWTRAYTAWLAPAVRATRRAEIDSDLWEHLHDANDGAAHPRSTAGQILARCLLGMGADLTWRVQMAAGPGRLDKEAISMNDRIKRDWWIPALIVLSGLSVFFQLTYRAGDEHGSDPSRGIGAIAVIACLFVVLPIWAIAVRRRHPGWTVVLLLPIGILSLGPLAWGEVTRALFLSALGIVTLAGAIVNLAQRSLEEVPESSSPEAQRAGGSTG